MTLRLLMLALFLLSFSTPSFALDWQNLWLNKDQRGKKALEQENYQQAAEQFKQAEWQAYSHYKNGEFEQAAQLFSADNAISVYNKGNALAQLGDFEGAITAYQQALEMQPDFADAKANKELLEQLLEQQQQEQESQESDQEKQSSDEQQQDSEQQNGNQQNGDNSQPDEGNEGSEQNSDQQEQQNSEQSDDQNNDQGQSEQERAEQESSEQESQAPDDEVEQNDAEQQSAQNTDKDGKEKDEQEAALPQLEESELSPEELEQQKQLEQWFRGVDDNPGELLKNKFRYQYEQNRRRQQHIDRESDQVW